MHLILDNFTEFVSVFFKHGAPTYIYLEEKDIITLAKLYPTFYDEYIKDSIKTRYFHNVPIRTGFVTPGTIKLVWD